jgi:hypothetical protein
MNGKTLANTGKQFYTWGTLVSFAGATVVTTLIWSILKGINPGYFGGKIVALIVSLSLVGAFAFLTEPEEKTTWRQKGQKAIITFVNGLLVYSAVLGGNVTMGGG